MFNPVKMKAKRGVTQIDWIISLSIFLLFLTLFFVFARPALFTTIEARVNNVDVVYHGLEIEALSEIREYPLLIDSSIQQNGKVLILDYPFSNEPASIEGRYFTLEGDSLLFLDDTKPQKYMRKMMLDGKGVKPLVTEQFYADENTSQSDDIELKFEEYVLKELEYKGEKIIQDFDILINNQEIEPDAFMLTSSGIHSRHRVFSEVINHSTMFFANGHEIRSMVENNDGLDKVLRIRLRLKKFNNFYSDNSFFGGLDYDEMGCFTKEWNFINLYGPGNGLSLKFSNMTEFTLCPESNYLLMYIDFDVQDMEYRMFVHEETEANTRDIFNEDSIVIGHVEKYKLLDIGKLENITYEDIKARWGISLDMDFSIKVLSENGYAIYEIGPEPYDLAKVTSKQFIFSALNYAGEKVKYTVIIKVW